ncbi:MAG: ABC transporter ATP-binding protein [Methylobacteriaceae bacterium]|nr:ABC transporter ATP-binding protein [Methylobacteriaceae bacterium]
MTLRAQPAAQPAPPLLAVENLVTTFRVRRAAWRSDELRAVNDVSFEIQRGRTLGLVGESGCGKSTLGRTILALTPAASGKVRFEGVDLLALSGARRRDYSRRIQVVFQDPNASLDPRFTAHDVIAEPLRIHDAYDHGRVEELMRGVGLSPSVQDLKPAQFSGGQRQRIAIARALALSPDMLILDEAVSALDVSIQAQVINLLKELQARQTLSYLFISHNLGVVRHIADDVAVMYLGRIVEIGPTHRVFSQPRHPYTRSLLSAVPAADPRRKASRDRIVLQGDPPNPLNPPEGCAFRTRCYRARPECRSASPPLAAAPFDAGHRVACLFPHEDQSR